jgi:hypothetical protein
MRAFTAVGMDMTLDQAGDTMNALIKQGSTSQHQLGTIYNYIVDRRLPEISGYKNAQDFFTKKVKALSQSTLSMYGTVARGFSEAACTQYGMGNLRELLRYADAAGTPIPADPGPMSIDVPGDDGKVVAKPFSECSVDELERARRAKLTPPPARVPVADQARLLFLEDSLFRRFQGVAEVRFSSRSKGGKTLITLQDVPMAEVERLSQALLDGMDAEPTLAAPEHPTAQ